MALSMFGVISLGIVGLVLLAYYLHQESERLIDQMQAQFEKRILKHNQDRASLSITKTKMQKLEDENQELRRRLDRTKEERPFASNLSETEFVERTDEYLQKLGTELSSIQAALNGDFREKLNDYRAEVDRLNRRLVKAQDEFTSHVGKNSLDQLDPKNIS